MASNDESINDDNDNLDFTIPLGNRENRRTYLITYAQADLLEVPSCLSFSELVLDGFNSGKSTRHVQEWACCKEPHQDGGVHYHMAVKLSGTRRWNAVKNYIYQKHGISLHFSSQHCGYVAAYRYVCKDKNVADVLHSPGHSNLTQIGSPKTKKAMRANNNKRRLCPPESDSDNDNDNAAAAEAEPTRAGKAKRLSNMDVSDFIVKNNIKKDAELMQAALSRSANGEKDLQTYILNKTPKALSDLISTTWKMQNAPQSLEREQQSRISVIRSYASGECVDSCGGQWLECAKEVLRNNRVNLFFFACAMRRCFIHGRQKNRNILIIGPTNCGKSFLLNPIELMFHAFVNPASGRYAWVGLDECEVAYLNDFRWTSESIAWSDFLLLLEGQTVHLPRPKNQFATDMRIDRENTIPFFATSKAQIEFVGRYGVRDDRESDMMSSRWLTFEFHNQIRPEDMKQLSPCPYCFSKLVLEGSEGEELFKTSIFTCHQHVTNMSPTCHHEIYT